MRWIKMSKTAEEILAITKEHGFLLKEKTLKLNESGLDFQVGFATDEDGKDWILRLPRREDVFVRTVPEKVALDFIHGHVTFEVPKWEIYTEKLIAYKAVTGVPAATVDMEKQAYVWEIDEKNVSEEFIQSLAKAIVDLHRIPKEKASDAGIESQSIDKVRQQMKKRMDKVKEKYGVEETLWSRWQAWVNNDDMWPKETALIHGDLHPGHIIVDKNEKVTGLIDWTEAKIADISRDFLGHLAVFGEEGLDQLLRAYIEAGGYQWPQMKEHIIELSTTTAIDIAEFALISGLSEYEEMAKQALGVT